MATIKSFTDLSQSRKLAEILPLESADMYYPWYIEEDGDTIESGHRISTPNIGDFITHKVNKMVLPCWSLASLLGMLPKRIEIVDNVYELSVYFYGLYYWNINNGNLCFESKDKDNIVDACVDMIIKLHELNLL
jgi:hypothetical protein